MTAAAGGTFWGGGEMVVADSLLSSFYASGQVASQEQGGERLSYTLDAAGRIFKVVGSGKTGSEAVDHYASPGGVVAWASEGEGKWSRDVYGIDGALAAVVSSGGETVLELHDLQGDVVGTGGCPVFCV